MLVCFPATSEGRSPGECPLDSELARGVNKQSAAQGTDD